MRTPPPEFPDPPDKLGGDRAAKYVLPEQYDPAQKWPLVVVLHGYGANLGRRNISGGEIQDTYLGISARASELGFIALIPHGNTDTGGKRSGS